MKQYLMDKKFLVLTGTLLAYISIRIYVANLSSFGFYHGYNEALYSTMGKAYFTKSLWYMSGESGNHWFYITPLYSYLVFVYFKIFGISELSGRLVSLSFLIFTVPFIYLLTRELLEDRFAPLLASVIYIMMPWNVLWGGRILADPTLTALLTASIAVFVYCYNHNRTMIPFGILFGLAVFAKQTAILILVVIFVWALFSRHAIDVIKKITVPVLIGLLPLAIWVLYHMLNGNPDVLMQLFFEEAFHRTPAFSNVDRVLLAIIFGASPFVLLEAFYGAIRIKNKLNVLFIWLVVYGSFFIIRTPASHEYYILPILPPLAILSAKGILYAGDIFSLKSNIGVKKIQSALALVTLLSTVPVSYSFLAYAGDLGNTNTRDAGEYLNKVMNQNPEMDYTIIAPYSIYFPVNWYTSFSNVDYSKRPVYGIKGRLSLVNVSKIINNPKTTVFLIVNEDILPEERLINLGSQIYSTAYVTHLPQLPSFITNRFSSDKTFQETIVIYSINSSVLNNITLKE